MTEFGLKWTKYRLITTIELMTINLTSANIRFENPADGANDWPKRRDFLADILNRQNLDLLGTQEGRAPQLRNLESLLINLSLSDQHRDWIEERMYPCIFFNPKTIEIKDSGDIWLSKTPYEAGTKDFDSAFPRLCTWIKAQHTPTNHCFFYVNCHLDHVKEETRIEQARVLCEEVLKINIENLPLLITGDFNASPQGEVRGVLNSLLNTIQDPWLNFNLPEETSFHKFDGIDPTGEATRIDWLLHTQELACKKIELIKESRNGQFPSDHFFVHGQLKFRT